jgi:hypothetical protein
MEKKSVFSAFFSWLKSTEMFARPSKQLPGKWQLFEYYIDSDNELLHIDETQLIASNEKWLMEFAEDRVNHQSSLSVPLSAGIENGTWSLSKNFITFLHPVDFRKNLEFQFAIEKNRLKLLRKDGFGKIEFFGFFKKLD